MRASVRAVDKPTRRRTLRQAIFMHLLRVGGPVASSVAEHAARPHKGVYCFFAEATQSCALNMLTGTQHCPIVTH